MKLTLGFSTCPNDTFMFDAIVHKKIDTEDLEFNVVLADIEELNRFGIQGKLDITKLSYHAFIYCVEEYLALESGSAIGRDCGPLLIKNKESNFSSQSRIAIPGKYTTANMLMDIAYPNHRNKVELLFSDIEDQLCNHNIDAGLIIHESRFTYKSKGLIKIQDLGEFWRNRTSLPIPLGGIFVKRSLPYDTQKKIDRIIKKSIEYALNNRDESFEFIQSHAQELDKDIVEDHINLYVNDFSISLGREGKSAIEYIFKEKGMRIQEIFVRN